MVDWLTEDDARARLARKIAQHGSQKAFAAATGCSESLVSAALLGRKPIGPKLAPHVGLIAQTQKVYRYLEQIAGEVQEPETGESEQA